MAAQRDPWRLFGLDLRALWHAFRSDWSDALRGRPFVWLTRVEPVRLFTLAGTESVRHGCSAAAGAATPRPDAMAIELPPDLVLERTITVPDLPHADIDRIVELDVTTHAPFAEADLTWGWQRIDTPPDAPPGPVRIALAARPHVEQFLASRAEKFGGLTPEVWFDAARPLLLRGWGETRRRQRERRLLAINLGLVGLFAVALGALVLTPVLLARARTFEAQKQFSALQQRAAEAVKLRDAIGASNTLLGAISAQLAGKPDAAILLDVLTRALGDDVVLDRFELRGDLVRISGRASEAAKLLETLSAQPQFRAVHAPAAIARNAAGGKDTFVFEFNATASALSAAAPPAPAPGPQAQTNAPTPPAANTTSTSSSGTPSSAAGGKP